MKIAAAVVWLAALALAYALGSSTPAGSDSVAALEQTLEHRSPLKRSLGLSEFLLGLNPDNIEATLEHVEGQAYRFDQRDYELLMHAWVRFDSPAAVDWALTRVAPLKRRVSIALIRALGFHDPAAARSLLETAEPELMDPMFYAMVEGWAWSQHADDLASYLSRLPSGVNRQRATSALVTIILRDGVDELIAWVDHAPTDAGFKALAFEQSADAIAQIDPLRAARWVDRHIGEPYARQAPGFVIRRWFLRDPAAAMNWIVTLPEESGRLERVERAFHSWFSAQPQEARAWVMASTPDAAVDPAVRELVRRDFGTDPGSAMDLAHRIDDAAVRLHVQVSAGRSWYEQDRESFMEWLPESGLEGGVRDLILKSPGVGSNSGANPEPISSRVR
jgi:hypothetical protein